MPDRVTTSRKPKPRSVTPLYSSKIIKAGALLPDTKTLLAHWDLAASVHDNVKRIRRENLFGKASRSRVEDVLAIFRQRFLSEEAVTRTLVVLVREKFPAASLDRQSGGDKTQRVFLRADKTVDYGTLTKVMNDLRAAGYLKIALVGLDASRSP